MAGYRQSALLLHGLSEVDRHWILSQLNADDQRILVEQLTDLKNLGIPADPALITVTISNAIAATPLMPAAMPEPAVAMDTLQSASAAQIHNLLADEPVWLVRQVLALEDWAWREDYLTSLGAGKCERLRVVGDTPMEAGSKLAQHLRAQLSQRLANVDGTRASTQHAVEAQDLLASIKKAMGRWL